MNNESIAIRIKRLGGAGILKESDVPGLDAANFRVGKLMADGGWYDDTRIIEVSGQREGLRRMRELRREGFSVERRRIPNTRQFQYRLVLDDKPQTGHAEMADALALAVKTGDLFPKEAKVL